MKKLIILFLLLILRTWALNAQIKCYPKPIEERAINAGKVLANESLERWNLENKTLSIYAIRKLGQTYEISNGTLVYRGVKLGKGLDRIKVPTKKELYFEISGMNKDELEGLTTTLSIKYNKASSIHVIEAGSLNDLYFSKIRFDQIKSGSIEAFKVNKRLKYERVIGLTQKAKGYFLSFSSFLENLTRDGSNFVLSKLLNKKSKSSLAAIIGNMQSDLIKKYGEQQAKTLITKFADEMENSIIVHIETVNDRVDKISICYAE